MNTNVSSALQVALCCGADARMAYLRYMIKSHEMLQVVDQRFDRQRLAKMTYHEALERFTALWDHARAVGAVDHNDWRADLEPDIRIAHALNALSEKD